MFWIILVRLITRQFILVFYVWKKPILYIFFDKEGTALEYTAFINKFGIENNFPFTVYYGILSAIPRNWKQNIEPVYCLTESYSRLTSYISCSSPTETAFNYFIMNKRQTPKAIYKWEQSSNNDYDWISVFNMPFLAVREAKIQFFQFRFIHRIVATNVFYIKLSIWTLFCAPFVILSQKPWNIFFVLVLLPSSFGRVLWTCVLKMSSLLPGSL